MIAKERLYLDKSGKKVLKHASPESATLMCPEGGQIPKEYIKMCTSDGRANGKDIPNAPKDLPGITQAKLDSQKASAKHTNTQPMKDAGALDNKEKKSGLSINKAKKE